MLASEVTFIGKDGGDATVNLGTGMHLYHEAQKRGLSLREYVNLKYPTSADAQADTFVQMCISSGLRFNKNDTTGEPAANLLEIFDPSIGEPAAAGSFDSQPANPASRILFPAAIMEVMEDKLQGKENLATMAFEDLVGFRKTIATDKFETPVLSYSGTDGPEDSQFQGISQNTRPPLMLSLTASDHTRKVPTTSIGMEISRQALASNSLDVVALSLARFYKMADYNEWCTQLGYVLSGDPDAAVSTFSAGTSALPSVTAASFDSTVSAAGVLSQKAYLSWLYANSMSMTKSHLVMDFNAALAFDNRTGRPTNVQDNSSDRLDIPFQVIYPNFQDTVKVVVMPAGKWTANTILGIDRDSPGLCKVTSTFADYQAVEDVVMKRSMELRIDRGFIVYRSWDDAFSVLTLTT